MIRSARPPSAAIVDYWQRSRSRTYGILFAMPLFVAYEVLAATMNAGETVHLRNAADLLVRRGLALVGARSTLAVTGLLIVAGLLIVLRDRRGDPAPLVWRTFGFMLAESTVLALAFGSVVGALTGFALGVVPGHAVLPTTAVAAAASAAEATVTVGLGAQLVLALGAGLYEELVFRVLLIPALALALGAAGLERRQALAAAAFASALVFSAAHYLGPLGDAFALGSFVFRLIGGLAFSGILVLRGFGIVAWTHALYDVFLILAGA